MARRSQEYIRKSDESRPHCRGWFIPSSSLLKEHRSMSPRMRGIAIAGGIVILISAAAAGWLHHRISRYDLIISRAAARNGVDFSLVKSLIYEESWFRPDIRGPAGELGLMQITRAAASDFASQKGLPPFHDDRLKDPELNVEIGSWYLGQSVEHYKNSPHPKLFALLRYNAGESRADGWLRRALLSPPPEGASLEEHCLSLVDFPKTRAYAHRILQRSRNHRFWF
jgi:soluble lytic murein transglycosylase